MALRVQRPHAELEDHECQDRESNSKMHRCCSLSQVELIKWLSWRDLEAAEYRALTSCGEYMQKIVTSLEQPD